MMKGVISQKINVDLQFAAICSSCDWLLSRAAGVGIRGGGWEGTGDLII